MENKKKKFFLTDELIVEILLRLPVKSLVRFRCVSKSWLSFISDPSFAKSHFELAAARTHKLLCITTSDYEAQTLDLMLDASLHDDSAAVNLVLPHPTTSLPVNDIQILGSCRGFIMLDDYPYLIIWNPSIGVHKGISYSHIASNKNMIPPLYGFGYDASTDDYLVLIGWWYDANLVADIEIFSLRINSWNKVEGIHLPYYTAGDDHKAGSPLNGAIHWMAVRRDTSVGVIIVFDLIQRNFSEIPSPDGLMSSYFTHLRVLGGCLSLCFRDDNKTEIWMMKEYKVQSSWTKSFVVSTTEIPTNYFYPICFTKGGQIVGSDGMAGIVKLNDKGELLEHRTYCDYCDECIVATYTESLLSLPSDSGEAREDDQH